MTAWWVRIDLLQNYFAIRNVCLRRWQIILTGFSAESIVTFLLTGARLREMVQLDRGDIDLYQGTIRLHRKGGDVNILPLAELAKIELKTYLKQRKCRTRTRALFICCRNVSISPGAVWNLVKKYLKKSRIRAHGMGPHALRHTCATLLLSQGENLRVIQSLMNHKSLATTARYLHSRSQELVAAVNGLKLLGG
jgi:site-specific recombinase XerD